MRFATVWVGVRRREVDWTNDELRDAIRQEGIDPDKLVKMFYGA
jgi:hypothetical protein